MASPEQQRDRIALVLSGVEGLKAVVKYPPESPPAALPAVVIGEPTATFEEGEAARGLDSWEWPLLLLVSSGDYTVAQRALEVFLSRHGTSSIRAAVAADPDLGVRDGTSAFLDRMENYGPREGIDGQRLLGAVLVLLVRTSG